MNGYSCAKLLHLFIAIVKTHRWRSVIIELEPSPVPIKANAQTQLKESFFKPDTEQIKPHIDYDLIIIDNSTDEAIFQAFNRTGQAGIPLHIAESIVTIPFTFSREEIVIEE
jgi:hypothetical protein